MLSVMLNMQSKNSAPHGASFSAIAASESKPGLARIAAKSR